MQRYESWWCRASPGRDGSFHTRQMMEYGTQVVAGVTPGKGGQTFEGPEGQTIRRSTTQWTRRSPRRARTPRSFTFRRRSPLDAMLEAADSGVKLVVAITEGVPVLDMARAHAFARDRGRSNPGTQLPWVAFSPGKCKVGISAGSDRGTEGPIGRRVALRHTHVRGGLPTDERGVGSERRVWALAGTPSSARTSSTASRRSRRIRIRHVGCRHDRGDRRDR